MFRLVENKYPVCTSKDCAIGFDKSIVGRAFY